MTTPASRFAYDAMPSEERQLQRLLTTARTAAAHGSQREAFDLYCRAGHLLSLDREWQAAGTAYQDAARLRAAARQPINAGTISCLLRTASHCFLMADKQRDALHCLRTAATVLAEAGDFPTAAGHYVSMGQVVAAGDLERGIAYFEQAARLYETASIGFKNDFAERAWLSVGELAARQGDYHRAITIFEGVAQANLRDGTVHDAPDRHIFATCDYFRAGAWHDPERAAAAYFWAVLCYLCRDGPLAAKVAVVRCEDRLSCFASSVQRGVLRQAMGDTENAFTVKSLERVLTADAENTKKGYDTAYLYAGGYIAYLSLTQWNRMMLGRAVEKLRDAEKEQTR